MILYKNENSKFESLQLQKCLVFWNQNSWRQISHTLKLFLRNLGILSNIQDVLKLVENGQFIKENAKKSSFFATDCMQELFETPDLEVACMLNSEKRDVVFGK